MTRIKVCGITREEDARLAVELGASYLGFVFHPASPRYVEPDQARKVVQGVPQSLETVGVFVNATLAEIERVLRISGIRIAQLHGDETPEFLRELTARGVRTIKALRPRQESELKGVTELVPSEGFLLDAPSDRRDDRDYGGTGRLARWELAPALQARSRLFLAGGLRPENVGRAIREVRPWAVDVSSGLEESPGIKSAGKMRQFFEKVGEIRDVQP